MRRSVSLSRWIAAIPLVLIPVLASGQDETPAAAPAVDAEVELSRTALCLRVEERQPVDVDTIFPDNVGQLFAFTRVGKVDGPTRITHVWYFQDREMARVDLQVGGNGWRTWSSKKILPAWSGDWKVDILDARGTRIKTLDFRVGEAEMAGATD